MTTIQRIDHGVDLLRAILWQYDGADGLQSLLADKADWYDAKHRQFWEDWRRDVFDLTTANDFGLTVWAIILDMPLNYELPGTGGRDVFGFGEFNQNFEHGNFGRDASGTQALTTAQKRLVLRLRYFQLISDGTVPHSNFVLKTVFGQGYVLDQLDMTLLYVFPSGLSSEVRAVLQEFDLLPRPSAVKVDIEINPAGAFGFSPHYQNFENGSFGA